MTSISDSITRKLALLAQSLELNERELENCINKVKQLPKESQEQFSSFLNDIKEQLKPINVDQLTKVKSVIGIQKHSGPALLSHIELCLNQNQLIANSINQALSLITQAYNNSLHDPGKRSRVIQEDIAQESQDMQLTPNSPSPSPSPSPRPSRTGISSKPSMGSVSRINQNTPNVPLNTPLLSNYGILRPEMVLLAKMLRIKQEYKTQMNVREDLREDRYVDNEILRIDNEVDRDILEISRELDELKDTSIEVEEDHYMRDEILRRSKEMKNDFAEYQRSIKQELAKIMQKAPNAPAPEEDKGYKPSSPNGA